MMCVRVRVCVTIHTSRPALATILMFLYMRAKVYSSLGERQVGNISHGSLLCKQHCTIISSASRLTCRSTKNRYLIEALYLTSVCINE